MTGAKTFGVPPNGFGIGDIAGSQRQEADSVGHSDYFSIHASATIALSLNFSSVQGVVTASGKDLAAFAKAFIHAIALHRHFDRKSE
jgi:hypothetical protein